MISSELKYRITLQAPVQLTNEYGSKQSTEYVDTIISIWAGIKYIGGNKNILNYEMFASQILQFKIRSRSDFDESYRVKYKDKFYQIISINQYDDNTIITSELLQ
jgi:head-tail adaptor